jgi:hypothetical protein
VEGAGALPHRWRDKVDEVRGHCLPHLAGMSLVAVADDLVTACEQDATVRRGSGPDPKGGEVDE